MLSDRRSKHGMLFPTSEELQPFIGVHRLSTPSFGPIVDSKKIVHDLKKRSRYGFREKAVAKEE